MNRLKISLVWAATIPLCLVLAFVAAKWTTDTNSNEP